MNNPYILNTSTIHYIIFGRHVPYSGYNLWELTVQQEPFLMKLSPVNFQAHMFPFLDNELFIKNQTEFCE